MHVPLRLRLLATIGLPVLAACVVILGASFVRLAASERDSTFDQLAVEATVVAERYDAAFRRAATAAEGNARAIEADPFMPEDRIERLLAATLEDLPGAFGAVMAFEPGAYRPGGGLFAPYAAREPDGGVRHMNIDERVYDWYRDESWTWWHEPKDRGAGTWTGPYFDEGAGDVTMITYGEPFAGPDGSFRGVTTVDIALETLATRLADAIVGDRDFVIADRDGRLMASRRSDELLGTSLVALAEIEGWADLRSLVEAMVAGRTGTARVTLPDVPGRQLVAHAPIGATGWSLAFRVPEAEALAPVRRHALLLSAGLALTLVVVLAVVWFMGGRLVRPVTRLRDGVAAVAAGDLDARVEGVERRDEVGELAHGFNHMTDTLARTLERLSTEQADRARIERDLDLAREIQRGLLPRRGLDLPGFTVAGWNRPADKTGGDYYDWLPLPGDRAIVTLADVTGHGIGPALIVAACRAYMRASAGASVGDGGNELVETLGRVNHLLAQDVGEGRFVTAAVVVIDAAARRLELLSAGQAPVLFVPGDGGPVEQWSADTVPLGVVEPLPCDGPRRIPMAPGDQLILLTDGFFEWANPRRELFGLERLVDSIARHRGLEPAEQIRVLHEDVLAFAEGTPQSDDLTAVVIRRD